MESLAYLELALVCAKHPFEKNLPSKIITGNNQDSIAVYRDASVRKKVGSHILALMAEKRSVFRYYWLRF